MKSTILEKYIEYDTDFFANTPLKLTSVDFRDGQQSLIATRMRTEDMVPVLRQLDEFGFESIEMWGGATFDSCIRYLQEDPWERVRTFKKYVTKTPLRMLLRGQNLLGYTQYSDDVVEHFVAAAANAGIDIFLIFDGLNDIRNCETAARAALQAHKRVEGNIEFTSSPVHTTDSFVKTAKEFVAIGASAICLEDMGGMIDPVSAGKTIAAIKNAVDIPVNYHAHCTGGMSEVAYWEAIRAGADAVDVDISPFALKTSHPAAESIIAMLKGTPRDTGLDYTKLSQVSAYLKTVRMKYDEFSTQMVGPDISVVQHQVPGGMRSNLEFQLKQMNASNKLNAVLEEVVQVRKDLGYPPLATPFSQMCGAQATMNVLSGQRYSVIPKEIRAYVRGEYGRAPGPISEELKRLVLQNSAQAITCRPADLLSPTFSHFKDEIGSLARTEEDILTYALFPSVAPKFLQQKYENSH